MSKRHGCAVLKLDSSGVIVEAVGLKKAKPESVLGLKVSDRIPYPTDALIYSRMVDRTWSTGEPTNMIVPFYDESEVLDVQIHLNKHGPDHLVMTAKASEPS